VNSVIEIKKIKDRLALVNHSALFTKCKTKTTQIAGKKAIPKYSTLIKNNICSKVELANSKE
jgi:hypothetical protein